MAKIHAFREIRTRDPRHQDADPRQRPRGHWNRRDMFQHPKIHNSLWSSPVPFHDQPITDVARIPKPSKTHHVAWCKMGYTQVKNVHRLFPKVKNIKVNIKVFLDLIHCSLVSYTVSYFVTLLNLSLIKQQLVVTHRYTTLQETQRNLTDS